MSVPDGLKSIWAQSWISRAPRGDDAETVGPASSGPSLSGGSDGYAYSSSSSPAEQLRLPNFGAEQQRAAGAAKRDAWEPQFEVIAEPEELVQLDPNEGRRRGDALFAMLQTEEEDNLPPRPPPGFTPHVRSQARALPSHDANWQSPGRAPPGLGTNGHSHGRAAPDLSANGHSQRWTAPGPSANGHSRGWTGSGYAANGRSQGWPDVGFSSAPAAGYASDAMAGATAAAMAAVASRGDAHFVPGATSHGPWPAVPAAAIAPKLVSGSECASTHEASVSEAAKRAFGEGMAEVAMRAAGAYVVRVCDSDLSRASLDSFGRALRAILGKEVVSFEQNVGGAGEGCSGTLQITLRSSGDNSCWDFARRGICPRGAHCPWQHVEDTLNVEVFS